MVQQKRLPYKELEFCTAKTTTIKGARISTIWSFSTIKGARISTIWSFLQRFLHDFGTFIHHAGACWATVRNGEHHQCLG